MLAIPPPACAPAQLRPAVLGSNGAAGTILVSITLRNEGRTCSLRGYPPLRLIGALGPLPTRVRHGGLAVLKRPVRTIRLPHGARATVLIAYNDVPVGSEKRCPAGTALEVGGVRIRVPTHACGHGRLLESPYLAGAVRP